MHRPQQLNVMLRRAERLIPKTMPGASHYYVPDVPGRFQVSNNCISSCACFSAGTLQAAQGIILELVQMHSVRIIGVKERPIAFLGILVFFYIGEWLGMAVYRSLRKYTNLYLITSMLTFFMALIELAKFKFENQKEFWPHFNYLLSGVLHTHFFFLSDRVVSIFTPPRLHSFAYTLTWAFRLVVELLIAFVLQIIKNRGIIITQREITSVSFYALIICVFLAWILIAPALYYFNMRFTAAYNLDYTKTKQLQIGSFASLTRFYGKLNRFQHAYILIAALVMAIMHNSPPLYYYYYSRQLSSEWIPKMEICLFELIGVVFAAMCGNFLTERMILVATVAVQCVIFNMGFIFPEDPRQIQFSQCIFSFAAPMLWHSVQSEHMKFVQIRYLHISQSTIYAISGICALFFQAVQFLSLTIDTIDLESRLLLSMSTPYILIWLGSEYLLFFYPAKV